MLTYSIVERPLTQFQWVSRAGALQQLLGEPGTYYTFDLSADDSRLAFAAWEKGGSPNLRVLDLRGNVPTHLTFGASYADPRWMADGQKLLATRWRPLPQTMVQFSPDRRESMISVSGDGNMVEDVSRDGTYLLYRQRGQQLWAMSLSEGSKPFLVRKAPAGGINQAQFSPDGRWIAYHANESGRFEVLYYLGLDGTIAVLRSIAPPAVRMTQMPHELCRRFVVHPRPRQIAPQPVESIRLDPVVDEPPDPAFVNHLVEVVLLDLRAQVGARSREVPDLDDAVVHVGDGHRPVRRGRDVHRTEVRVERLDELVSRIRVVKDRQAILVLRMDLPDDARDRFAGEQLADELLRQAVAAKDVVAGAGRDASTTRPACA